MTKLVWDQTATDGRYEAGVDRGVFYPSNGPGIVWNGLTSVQESPSGADESTRYIDGVKTRNGRKPSEFAGTIEAYSYPEKLYDDVLSRRKQQGFGFSYRVMTGESSYKIHLVYNVLLGPDNHEYQYEGDSTFSWDFTTKPVHVPYMRPTSHLVIDSSVAYPETIAALEDLLYGSDAAEAKFPTPADVLQLFEDHSILQIIDNGDGTWTAIGPADAITINTDGSFSISWPSAVWVDNDTYTIHSL